MSLQETARGRVKHDDLSFAALWSKGDGPYVARHLKRDKLQTFEDRLQRVYNDQTAWDDLVKRHVEPLQVEIKKDLVVTAGMTRLAQLATGASTTSFRYFASGTSNAAESLANTTLGAESARVDMDLVGDRYPSGTSMKFAGFFDTTAPTATIIEGGAFDAASVGTMFFRSVYASSLAHTQNVTVYSLSQSISQSSS